VIIARLDTVLRLSAKWKFEKAARGLVVLKNYYL